MEGEIFDRCVFVLVAFDPLDIELHLERGYTV